MNYFRMENTVYGGVACFLFIYDAITEMWADGNDTFYGR